MAVSAFAQQQNFRWGKWTESLLNEGSNTPIDMVVDSYVDSSGNTYVLGQCGKNARLGANGPLICPMDTVVGYTVEKCSGLFLAKIDTSGEVLWCKSARNGSANSFCIPWHNMVADNKITIAFSHCFGGESFNWFFFFDTMLIEPSYQFHVTEKSTFFVTFDLDGNRVGYHQLQMKAYYDFNYDFYGQCFFDMNSDSRSFFLIDDDNAIHIFATGNFYAEDSLHKAYITVDGDTSNRYHLDLKTLNGTPYSSSVYLKLDPDWNIVASKYLVDSISGWNPTGFVMTNLEVTKALLVDDYIYADCLLATYDFFDVPDSLPLKVFLDSVHYLVVGNASDWISMPCLLKMNLNGDIVWLQQLHVECEASNNYEWVGGIALDEDYLYACYNLSNGAYARYYVDSAHRTAIPLGSLSGCSVVAYDRTTGAPVDIYVVDTDHVHYSDCSLALVGDNLVLHLGFNPLRKTELCLIDKHTKSVSFSLPVFYETAAVCRNMSVNPYGWVFRSTTGHRASVYDSISLGNQNRASVMTFFYDPSLDMRCQHSCPPVDTLCATVAGQTVSLTWRSNYYHAGYELAYIPEGGNWNNATIVTTDDTAATVALSDGQCHLFRVRALCDGDRSALSPWSNTVTACPHAAVDDADTLSAITLYPNPTNGVVHVSSPCAIESATLADLTGHRQDVRLRPDGPGRYAIDLPSLPSAPYFLTLTTADGDTHTLRLVLLR